MAKVEIYSSMFCPYCHRAKRLLDSKGVAYEEIDVDAEPGRRREMTERAGGRRTVPQIFIDGRHMGGCDDIHALDRQGKLDPLLGASA
ncbi:MAG: glutaredoxin 3 [Alphaproteobacteria bacterium]